jgi:hypothetical protein
MLKGDAEIFQIDPQFQISALALMLYTYIDSPQIDARITHAVATSTSVVPMDACPKTLTVTKSGNGSGEVFAAGALFGTEAGFDCGNVCEGTFDIGSTVTLTATPDGASIFSGWTGDCSSCGSNTTCEISMTSNKTCKATFELLSYVLTSFNAGWNFISFPKLPKNTSLSSIFENKPVRIVWSYDNETKRWKRWRPDFSFNTLSAIEPKKGYWVYADEPFQIETKDWVEPQDKTMTLYPNWNLIGWLGEDGKSVSDALNPLSGNWIIIWSWENGTWRVKHSDSNITLNFEPLQSLYRGKAYWIKVKEEILWNQN